MSTPFLGEIRLVSFSYPPKGWAFCSGQLLSINQNTALFSLLGTLYGGNGTTNFALPNLLDRVPIHFGNGYQLGQTGGSNTVTLSVNQIPAHHHSVAVSTGMPTTADPTQGFPAHNTGATGNAYYLAPNANMNSQSVGQAGGGQPHSNLMPFQALTYVIALVGIYPSRP